MGAIILGLINSVPSIINAINSLIARGRKSGELPASEADDLTRKANLVFAKFAAPAPPPPNFGGTP
jgi:hypothetical protein